MLEQVKDIAQKAGEILLDKYNKKIEISHKGAIDLVTEADLASEKFIVDHIQNHFPDHSIIAEENHRASIEDEYVWIIDPLDGTNNFAHSYPQFCVSIGVFKHGEPYIGVVHNPYYNECFYAQKDQGAFLNNISISVSDRKKLIQCLLATGFPYCRLNSYITNVNYFNRMIFTCQGIRRSGSAAIDLCSVACGRIDGFWEFNLKPWDTAAGVLICSEAGARISGIESDEWDINIEQITVSNPHIHHEMLENLRAVKKS